MPASLSSHALSVRRGPTTVLDSIDLTLAPGDRVGVVGPNGIGKSTLLQALAGLVPFDAGSVDLAPPSATVGYLPQEPERSPTESVEAFLARRTGVAEADVALEGATAALAAGDAGAADRYSVALDRWTALGAADLEARIGVVFDELGTPAGLRERSMATLSGGEAARVMLASILLSRFDIVLLDEPTNDLDLDGLERLERWVVGVDGPLALVSHDRTFLERTVTAVVEIDHHDHRATRFNGGWTAYLDERDNARRLAQERYDQYASKREALAGRAQQQREWAVRGTAALRRSGENDKNIRAFRKDQTEQLAGKARQTDRALERLDRNEAVDEPRTPWELRLHIPTAGRSGDVVSTLRGAVVERPGFTLGPVDLAVAFGDRVAILGPNGSGKSTLVDLLVGRLSPTSGAATLGASVVLGEIEQDRDRIIGNVGLLRTVTDRTGLTDNDARRLLAKFRLGPDQLDRPGRTLSPGERTRAALALLQANGANLLVLDEPSNHLDLEAIEQVEHALADFGGTVLLVTHDRSMLEQVDITRTLEVVDGRVHEL